jgi:hypothetical protein
MAKCLEIYPKLFNGDAIELDMNDEMDLETIITSVKNVYPDAHSGPNMTGNHAGYFVYIDTDEMHYIAYALDELQAWNTALQNIQTTIINKLSK